MTDRRHQRHHGTCGNVWCQRRDDPVLVPKNTRRARQRPVAGRWYSAATLLVEPGTTLPFRVQRFFVFLFVLMPAKFVVWAASSPVGW
jgi:hypothetical protein